MRIYTVHTRTLNKVSGLKIEFKQVKDPKQVWEGLSPATNIPPGKWDSSSHSMQRDSMNTVLLNCGPLKYTEHVILRIKITYSGRLLVYT